MKNEQVHPNVSEIPVKISPWHTHAAKKLSHLHYHDEIELLCCSKGSVCAVIDNAVYKIHPNEILFINSRVPHETFCDEDDSTSMFIQFRRESFLTFPSNELSKYLSPLKRNTTAALKIIKNPLIFESICTIVDEQREKQPGFINLTYAHIHIICGLLTREGIFSDDTNTDVSSLQKLLPAMMYIDENYGSDLSLEKVSSASGLNKYYFCRLFKKTCGVGFSEYINFVRISKAEKMLRKTDKTVLEVALDTGFSSVSYFNSIFRKYRGCTPSACRNAINYNI
jgi:AraC-like DNA-binding protein